MPQFDQSSFFNQVTWFLSFFYISYFLITYFFLPKISHDLKFRKKKVIIDEKTNFSFYSEKKFLLFFLSYLHKHFYLTCAFTIDQIKNSYIKTENRKIQKQPFLNIHFKKKITYLLNQNYLFLTKCI